MTRDLPINAQVNPVRRAARIRMPPRPVTDEARSHATVGRGRLIGAQGSRATDVRVGGPLTLELVHGVRDFTSPVPGSHITGVAASRPLRIAQGCCLVPSFVVVKGRVTFCWSVGRHARRRCTPDTHATAFVTLAFVAVTSPFAPLVVWTTYSAGGGTYSVSRRGA